MSVTKINYFIYFNTISKEDYHIQFELKENLMIGDTIDFFNEKYSEKLIEEFKTTIFIIKKRELILDSEQSNTVFKLLLEPFYELDFTSILLVDYKNNIYNKMKSQEDFEKWNYWFSGEGREFLTDFPNILNTNIGDIIDVYYTNSLFENGKLKRNFREDWGTSEIIIKKRIFFYNNSIIIEVDDYSEEIPANKTPTPTIFLKIELTNDDDNDI